MRSTLPNRASDYAAWYNALIKQAGLAESAPTRGCMVIKPYGYALWENIRDILDKAFKEIGHQNVYFPLMIPLSYMSREAKHVEGFAKECAVITHYRLKQAPEGKEGVEIDPKSALEEPLIVRPTSEVMFWEYFRKWIQSYRDLPLQLNQWANVVRWEMRTRPFLRTSEFLWQEGHTAHATAKEAQQETERMLSLYVSFVQDYLAIPVIAGEKTPNERFAGAQATYTMEGLMQDGKALQMGTSHFLGQNFAKAFDVKFASKEGSLEHVWGTSWGVTTRLIGALIMTHGDDQGLILPPKVAPIQVVIVPIYKKNTPIEKIKDFSQTIYNSLRAQGIRVKLDDRDMHQPGWKFNEYERKGVPIRLVVGPRNIEDNSVELARRDSGEKSIIPLDNIVQTSLQLLDTIQKELYQKALRFQKENTIEVDNFKTFKKAIKSHKGFILAHWDGTTETELAIKAETQATIRCIPTFSAPEQGRCIYSGKPSQQKVLFGQAY